MQTVMKITGSLSSLQRKRLVLQLWTSKRGAMLFKEHRLRAQWKVVKLTVWPSCYVYFWWSLQINNGTFQLQNTEGTVRQRHAGLHEITTSYRVSVPNQKSSEGKWSLVDENYKDESRQRSKCGISDSVAPIQGSRWKRPNTFKTCYR